MDKSSRLEGDDWQRWATQLLHRRYPVGDYQEVPDGHGGDAGIEGFSLDGCVYQMYGPEGELTFDQRHTKLRDKMTRDVKKFIDNQDRLLPLLGALKIQKWILFVPSFDSREIVEHATKKTAEVVAANLPYVCNDDFRVIVLNEDAFSAERAHLLSHAVANIVVQTDEITEEQIEAWTQSATNSGLVATLEGKIGRLPTINTTANRVAFRRKMIEYLLRGQNVMDALRKYPEVWEALRRVKSERERYLWTLSMASGRAPGAILTEALEQIRSEVKGKAAALSSGDMDAIAHEAAADWLMRCPLDFPEVSNNG